MDSTVEPRGDDGVCCVGQVAQEEIESTNGAGDARGDEAGKLPALKNRGSIGCGYSCEIQARCCDIA